MTVDFVIEPMRVEQIPAVHEIERLSFPQPWPQSAYRREINENGMAQYVVARDLRDDVVQAPVPEVVTSGAPAAEGWLGRLGRLLRVAPEESQAPGLDRDLRTLVGYAGVWIMVDEAHVTTIAAHPRVRGLGVGELLLWSVIQTAIARRANLVTLEVRASNLLAQNLYRKYTFKEMGVRKRYYSDNGEDALVMWTDPVDSPAFLEALDRNERRFEERIRAEVRVGAVERTFGDG